MSLTKVTYSMINGAPINVLDYGAVGNGTTDDTAAIQAALNVGGTVVIPDGTFKITSALTVGIADTTIKLGAKTNIDYSTVSTYIAVKINATDCSIVGGTFTGPASWDGANVAPTYGVIWVAADRCSVSTRLINVRKVGLWFKDVVDGTAINNIIEGNYPSASWTGTETAHFGVCFDPSTGASGGNFQANNNSIKTCVQGVFAANYGTGGVIQGLNVVGNLFESCWNHGVYTASANGANISGNTFNRCEISVASTGKGVTITANAIYTAVNTTGDARDVTGIQLRDSQNSVISSNTIKGVGSSTSAVYIDVINLDGTTTIDGNIVIGNTINITASAATNNTAIRIEGSTVTCSNNIIANNTVTCLGNTVSSVIYVGSVSNCNNNRIVGNTLKLTSGTLAFGLSSNVGSEIRGNSVEIAYDAGSATSAYATTLTDSSKCTVADNTSFCRALFGANITMYGFREYGSSANNSTQNNIDATDKTKLVAYTNFVVNSTTNLLINDSGIGVPSVYARPGSMWRNQSGGAGTTLYIKESAYTSTTWASK